MNPLFSLFFSQGETCEVRALGLSGKNSAWEGFAKGTVSGYYDDATAFARDAEQLDRAGASGVYFSLNPANPALLARAVNRIRVAKSTTQDKDVVAVRWLPIDLDPKRPADISATDAELQLAIEKGQEIAAWLEGTIGFARGLRCYSGNGIHLLYRLPDLPNDEETRQVIVAAIDAIKARFDDERIDIDPTVTNPARIWKLYGTTGRKGDATADRPHRRSSLFPGQPERLADVPVTSLEALQKLVAARPAALPVPEPEVPTVRPPPGQAKPFGNDLGPLDVERYLDHYGVGYSPKTKGLLTIYALDECVFNPDHNQGQASIIASPTGPLLYQCFHASCRDKKWKDARKRISGNKPIAEFCAGYNPDFQCNRPVPALEIGHLQVSSPIGLQSASELPPPEALDPMEILDRRGKRPVFVPMLMAKYIASYVGPIFHTSGIFWRYRNGSFHILPDTTIAQLIVAVMKDRSQPDMIQNSIKILSALVNREEKDWPDDMNLLCIKNGMLDLGNMIMLPHDPKYGVRVTPLPVNYNVESPAWSQRWWDHLEEVFPDDHGYHKRGLLQQFFGYCLQRNNARQAMLMQYGGGANGKTTVTECLQAVLGHENCSSIPFEELGERFKAQFLQNKLVNFCGEINQRKPLDTDFLKKVIGGDSITVDVKYGQQFQFKPFAKFIISLNEQPIVSDKSYGFARRLIVVNFNRRFTPDEIADKEKAIGGRRLSDYLIEEIDGIFAWIVEGFKILSRQNRFSIAEESQEETEQMLESLNPLLVFVNEMCEVHDKATVGTIELFELYVAWCASCRNRPLGRNKFLELIRMTFPRVSHPRTLVDGKMKKLSLFNGIGLTSAAREWYAETSGRPRGLGSVN